MKEDVKEIVHFMLILWTLLDCATHNVDCNSGELLHTVSQILDQGTKFPVLVKD